MMNLRAEFAINHAIRGFGMDFEKALELVRHTKKGLTQLEKDQRDILLAAIDNLVDFAVAEEYQVMEEIMDEFDTEDLSDYEEECEDICHKYNFIYAGVENKDISYELAIAAWWVMRSDNTVLTYMTQGDERVRPWHRALEGLSYPKKSFPAWLIPPIEHGCRCFLVEESKADMIYNVEAKKTEDNIPDFVNPVFRESVAKGGRIFSDAHSYFTIKKGDKKKLKSISKKIKKEWLKK